MKKHWTSWMGTPVLGWLSWLLPLGHVVYSGFLQYASGPCQWWSVTCEADTESSALGRFMYTCSLRCLPLQTWKFTQQVRKISVNIISFLLLLVALSPNRSGVKWKLLHRVQLFVTSWTVQSMEFFRPEYWSGYPFPSPGDPPNPGIKPRSPTLKADSLPAEPPGKPNRREITKHHCWPMLWGWLLAKMPQMQCLYKERYQENISDWSVRWLFNFFIKD